MFPLKKTRGFLSLKANKHQVRIQQPVLIPVALCEALWHPILMLNVPFGVSMRCTGCPIGSLDIPIGQR